MIAVKGVKEINDAFKAMQAELQHSVLQSVHAEAAIPLVNAAHFLAPVGRTGNLAESIGIEKPGTSRASELGQIRVGPRRSGRYKGFAGHLVEYGTRDRGRTGRMPAKPFMKPAFEQTNTVLFRNIDEILGKKMISAMRRKIKANGGTWLRVS